ncbi:MAG: DEAD/DEAH box helicase [Candidatus Woesearchaeota archaeon]|nr:DEAD/DEAH box helicase [Candidatus Woesearchaeota archaeon]
MQFKNFVLDPFQEDAVRSIDKGNSVVVSAATGTGKTLIADYIIDKYLKHNRRIIYTAPIKALSGQKYRDFKKDYGEENIGIMTGDVVINPDAPVLIMTTEIYRNMLLTKDILIDQVSYVIFDEIHYINDIERGTIWEESVIFSPEHMRFLCLSATIPNAEEFASWIQTIKKHDVDVVKYEKRAVPLEHYVYDVHLGVTRIDDVLKDRSTTEAHKKARRSKDKKKMPKPNHIDLIFSIRDKLPCIFFDFSRADTERRAVELSRKIDFLNNEQRRHVIEMANGLISAEYRSLESVQKLKHVLSKGIAFHHAGLLPKAKELVELLFSEGLIKVMYATETFAVGINMPAKSVCFASLEKFDGISFRYINSKEYFQLAGRAGRRGIDKIGYAIAMIERGYTDLEKVKRMSLRDDIPIQSQFKLSFNTVLNLINNHTPPERETILKMNFDYYLKKKESSQQVRIMATYNNKIKILKSLGYIEGDNLTDKGRFATKIYSSEILLTELFYSDIYQELSDEELNILIASVIYEPRGKDFFTLKGIQNEFNRIMRVTSRQSYVQKNLNKLHVKRMCRVIGDFTAGEKFSELLELCSLDEGDLIRLIRRIIDMIRQIDKATTDREFNERLHSCQDKLYRDVVKFEF